MVNQSLREGNEMATKALEPENKQYRNTLGFLADPTRHLFFTGKGGVGKTSLSTATALTLADAGKKVLLVSTDAASNLDEMLGVEMRNTPTQLPNAPDLSVLNIDPDNAAESCRQVVTLDGKVPGLHVSRIDPKVETQRYIDKIMAAKPPNLDAQEQALMLEDLRSPCTEEVAVFHAFSRIVSEGRSAFVVLDTAPTGHSMLLMDATGAYHRQMVHEFEGHRAGRIITPLMRLQDAAYTKIILVTLPEVTPVSQAAALQEDLRRASVEPYAWVLNKSVLGAGTHDPLLAARLAGECKQIERMSAGLAKRLFTLPWLTVPPIGCAELSKLVRSPTSSAASDTNHSGIH